jgi:hypothetical protein
MLVAHFFDLVPIWLLLVGTILVMRLFIEIGFRLAKRSQVHAKKAQTSQVRAIMGAGLGLLAFMLAFTFSTAQSHFETRVLSLAEEARIVRNAYMQADLLAEPARSQAKHLLRDYVQVRNPMNKFQSSEINQKLTELLEYSEKTQHKLWILASGRSAESAGKQFDPAANGALMASVLALTDIHYTRLHSATMNRIPLTIWMTLYLMAILSMVIMGYQAGLTDRRSPVATVTLALAFSAVITLIADLDRPVMSLFDINRQLLIDLGEYMDTDLSLEYYPAGPEQ